MDLDRHRNASDDDVMTEFEEKFVRENKPIYELEAWRKRRK
jgi:tRNA G46 methylase TrmB